MGSNGEKKSWTNVYLKKWGKEINSNNFWYWKFGYGKIIHFIVAQKIFRFLGAPIIFSPTITEVYGYS